MDISPIPHILFYIYFMITLPAKVLSALIWVVPSYSLYILDYRKFKESEILSTWAWEDPEPYYLSEQSKKKKKRERIATCLDLHLGSKVQDLPMPKWTRFFSLWILLNLVFVFCDICVIGFLFLTTIPNVFLWGLICQRQASLIHS